MPEHHKTLLRQIGRQFDQEIIGAAEGELDSARAHAQAQGQSCSAKVQDEGGHGLLCMQAAEHRRPGRDQMFDVAPRRRQVQLHLRLPR